MRKKKDLEKGIIIEDNLTWQEREIQQNLRQLASDEREKGKKVKIGYMKMSVNEKWDRWNKKKEELEEEKGGRQE